LALMDLRLWLPVRWKYRRERLRARVSGLLMALLQRRRWTV